MSTTLFLKKGNCSDANVALCYGGSMLTEDNMSFYFMVISYISNDGVIQCYQCALKIINNCVV